MVSSIVTSWKYGASGIGDGIGIDIGIDILWCLTLSMTLFIVVFITVNLSIECSGSSLQLPVWFLFYLSLSSRLICSCLGSPHLITSHSSSLLLATAHPLSLLYILCVAIRSFAD